MGDSENKESLLKLMRYSSNFQESEQNLVGLEDYVKKMKPGQQKIYFVFGPTKAQALNSPFMEPFK